MKVKQIPNFCNVAHWFVVIAEKTFFKDTIRIVKNSLREVAKLFKDKTSAIENSVFDRYLFSISGSMEIHESNQLILLPNNLKKEYYKQLNTSRIC